MPDERDEDERLEERDEDDDAGDEDEARDDQGAVLAGEGDDESQVDAPRNRAERRAEVRRTRREAQTGIARPRASVPAPNVTVPRPTLRGKSSSDEVPPWARGTATWLNQHRGVLAVGAAVVVGVAGVSVFWNMHTERSRGEAAASYTHALEIDRAPIRAADAPAEPAGSPPIHGPTYVDPAARSRAALAAVQQTTQHFGDAPVSGLAHLTESETLYDLGRYAEARRVLEALVATGSDLAGLQVRAYETLGFVLEALNDQTGALHRYETMATLDNGAWRDLAQFHQARVLEHQGNAARAKDLLHGVIERIQHSRPDDTTGPRNEGSVLEQARLLLHDIDPTDTLGRRSENPSSDPSDILRQLQQRGQLRGLHLPTGGGEGE